MFSDTGKKGIHQIHEETQKYWTKKIKEYLTSHQELTDRVDDLEHSVLNTLKLNRIYIKENTDEIKRLRKELDDRRYINNYSKEEKEWLKERIQSIGTKAEDTDHDLYTQLVDLKKGFLSIIKDISTLNGELKIIKWLVPLMFSAILIIQGLILYRGL